LYNALLLNEPIENTIITTELPLLWVIPADKNLAGAEIELVETTKREYLLKGLLNKIRNNFDYIIIDCPPSLGLLTINGLTAADSLLVPIQCEYYALEGVTELFDTLARLRRGLNPQLVIEGLLLTFGSGCTRLEGFLRQSSSANCYSKKCKTSGSAELR
jgi:chromosome partitioning protein